MAKLPSHAEVVIIGGGAAGCSSAYHLAKMGCTDVLVLEKNELTAGSTWHAAGNCPNFSGNREIMRMQAYSIGLYETLAADVDYPIGYHQTGAVRLAQSTVRLDEFKHVAAMGRAIGLDLDIVTPAELQQHMPHMETHGLLGGLWDPKDGHIDPAQLTQAFAKGARTAGVKIRRFCPVTAITLQPSGEWAVTTPDGIVIAEKIVNAAGYYAPVIGRMVGREVPCAVMEHQYIVTEDHPTLANATEKFPMLRDPDDSYYLRQEGNGLLLGPYEKQATPAWRSGMPDDFSFELYSEDLERLEWYIEQACARVPILGEAGVKNVINGPIPYTPDGNPLIGPVPGLKNFYECCVFTFGIAQSGGAGKILAEWVVEGSPEWDMWACDPRRFTDYTTPEYCESKAIEVYAHEYAMHLPFLEWPAGRPMKTSPLYDRLAAKGAEFGDRGGWERAMWFPRPQDNADDGRGFHHPGWYDAVAEECVAVTENAGILDLPGFAKFEVTGEGAADWLGYLITGTVPKPGRIALSYFCNDAGKIVTEMTITCIKDGVYRLTGPAPGEWHDQDWLLRHLPTNGSVRIKNVTKEIGTLVLAGPRSRDILAKLTGADLSNDGFRWLTAQEVKINGISVFAMRVNYIGDLGWELHAPVEQIPQLYDDLWTAGKEYGLCDFGAYAMESLRLEKCYRAWKQDLSSEMSPLQTSLDRFVKLDKPDFIGKAALVAEKEQGLQQRFVPLLIDANTANAPFGSPVWKNSERIGYVSSSEYGHRIEKHIALAFLNSEYCVAGTSVEVEILGELVPAITANEPLFDPDNSRLRS